MKQMTRMEITNMINIALESVEQSKLGPVILGKGKVKFNGVEVDQTLSCTLAGQTFMTILNHLLPNNMYSLVKHGRVDDDESNPIND